MVVPTRPLMSFGLCLVYKALRAHGCWQHDSALDYKTSFGQLQAVLRIVCSVRWLPAQTRLALPKVAFERIMLLD
eukprot:12894735-Alexandrium_andersonii.AAC.1